MTAVNQTRPSESLCSFFLMFKKLNSTKKCCTENTFLLLTLFIYLFVVNIYLFLCTASLNIKIFRKTRFIDRRNIYYLLAEGPGVARGKKIISI